MTALTTMFNFLIVYVRYFCCIIFGGTFSKTHFSGEAYGIAEDLLISLGFNVGVNFDGIPILTLFIGIIVIGAIIGLARRLIRG